MCPLARECGAGDYIDCSLVYNRQQRPEHGDDGAVASIAHDSGQGKDDPTRGR